MGICSFFLLMHLVLGKAFIHLFIHVLDLAPFGFVREKQELYFSWERNSEKNRIDVLLSMRPILAHVKTKHAYIVCITPIFNHVELFSESSNKSLILYHSMCLLG